MSYKNFSGTYQTTDGSTYDFDFPACDWNAMLGDLLDSYGEGHVYGVRVN